RMPSSSKVAVLRLTFGPGSGKTVISPVSTSTRTIAFSPPSVIQGLPSGPTMTPCGADPAPSGISRTSPDSGSSQPSVPLRWPVYHTPPSAAGATSCGPLPTTTGKVSIANVGSAGGDGVAATVAVGAGVGGG